MCVSLKYGIDDDDGQYFRRILLGTKKENKVPEKTRMMKVIK